MPGIVPGAEQMDQQAKFSLLWNQHFNGGRESEQANRSIMQFQVWFKIWKQEEGKGCVCCDPVWCDIPPSAFNLHEDITVMNTLRLADSWPALRNWVQWKRPCPQPEKNSIQPLGKPPDGDAEAENFPGIILRGYLAQEMLNNIIRQKQIHGTGQSVRLPLTICL